MCVGCPPITLGVVTPCLLTEKVHVLTLLQLLSSHYTHFARYYESGQRSIGLASEDEKVWSALVVYRLLDSLSLSLPHERLERSCVSCLAAVSRGMLPDTLLPSQCQLGSMYQSSAVGYDPRPACIEKVTVLKPEVRGFVEEYANYLHDCWVFEQVHLYMCVYIRTVCVCTYNYMFYMCL